MVKKTTTIPSKGRKERRDMFKQKQMSERMDRGVEIRFIDESFYSDYGRKMRRANQKYLSW